MKKIVISVVVIAVIIAGSLAGSLLIIPKIVSSDWFRQYAQNQASSALNRDVRIKYLNWSWSGGITAEGVTLEEDPRISKRPVFYLGKARIRFDVSEITKSIIGVDILLNEVDLSYIREESGETNLGRLFPPKAAAAEEKQPETPEDKDDGQKTIISLPLDVSARVQLTRINVVAHDRKEKRQLNIEDFSVNFDMPSIYQGNAKLMVQGNVRIDEGNSRACMLSAVVDKKGERTGDIRPEDFSGQINGRFPGVQINVNGDLKNEGLAGKIDLNLKEIMSVVRPFLPAYFASSEIEGEIGIELTARRELEKSIWFDTTVNAVCLSAEGAIVKNRRMGPANLSIKNKGVVDLEKDRLDIQNGSIRILEDSRIGWKASISGMTSKEPEISAFIGPANINLKEIFDFSEPFLPEDLPLVFHDQKMPSNIALQSIQFSGSAGDGDKKAEIKDIAITLPRFDIKKDDRIISFEDLELNLKTVEADFKNLFPVQASISTNLTVGRVKMPGLLAVHDIRQSFSALCTLKSAEEVEIDLRELSADFPGIIVEQKEIGRLNTYAKVEFNPCTIFFSKAKNNRLDVEKGGVTFNVGDMLEANMSADVSDSARGLADTEGSLTLHLERFPAKFLSAFKEKADIAGDVGLTWHFSGRLPNAGEMEMVKSFSGIDSGAALAFVSSADVQCIIKNMKIALLEGKKLTFGNVSADPLVHYIFSGKRNSGEIDGRITVENIIYSPLMKPSKPAALNFSFNGTHKGLQQVSFSQKAGIEPFGIEESVHLSLFGADRIIEKKQHDRPEMWLSNAGVNFDALLEMKNISNLKQFKDDIDMSGRMVSGAAVRLLPSREVDARIWANIAKTNVRYGKLFSLKDLYGKINLKKKYRIVLKKENGNVFSGIDFLSARVLGPTQSGPGEKGLFHAGLWGYSADERRFDPDQTIGFTALAAGKGRVPVHAGPFKADFNLENGLPDVQRFQSDLFGGTAAGALKIDKINGRFYFNVILDFTGIDFAKILPNIKSREKGEDTEVSGHMNIRIPLTESAKTFLEDMEHHIIFTHIGSRALERLLFAMDPYESNEVIVSQRILLRRGSPRRIELTAKDGSLSLKGEVSVEGVNIEIPRLDRLSIINLPGTEKLGGHLSKLNPLLRMLEIASSNAIFIDENEKGVSFEN